MTHSPKTISELLERAGVGARKSLGQNFVADPNTVRRIARLAEVGPGDRVVEIGAGLGSLTLALAETGAQVTAVEIDDVLAALLREVVADHDVTVVERDATEIDWVELLGGGVWTLAANLPYNIATHLVLDLLADAPMIDHFVVMVQREVGERLCAGPGTKMVGIPSMKVAYWADAKVVARVPPTVFVPQPRVDSVVVDLRRRPQPTVDRATLWELLETSYGQRRKMIRRSLVTLLREQDFLAAEVSPESRPEQLELASWVALAEAKNQL